MKQDDIYQNVAYRLGLTKDKVEEAYTYFWRIIRETIESMPIGLDTTEEEYRKLKHSFNVPHIGKINVKYNKYYRERLKKYVKTKEGEADA